MKRWTAWLLCGVCLACGASSFEEGASRWNLVFGLLYGLPAVILPLPLRLARIASMQLGCVLIASTFLGLFSDPDYHALRPNVRVGGISTDRHGYRVIPPVEYHRKRGVRVFAIGASTTEEIYADDDKTWCHRLQQRLERAWGRPVEVINTGLSGLRAVHHRATLKHILRYNPDAVVILAGVNDWNEHIRRHFSARPGAKPSVVCREASWRYRLLARNTLLGQVVQACRGGRELEGQGAVRAPPQRGSLDRPVKRTFQPDRAYEDYVWAVEQIGEIGRRRRLPCLFLTQPTAYQAGASETLKKSFWMTPPRQAYTLDFDSMVGIARLYNDYLVRTCRARGLAVYDLASDFSPSERFFTDECHFTDEGSERVAEKVAPALTELLRGGERRGPR